MKTKETLKELVYLGTGMVVVTKQKIEEAVESLAVEHKIARDEGKAIVDELVKNSEALKADWIKRKDEFVDRFTGKVNATREDVTHFFEAIIEMPKEAKEALALKYDDMVNIISLKTSLAKHEVEDVVEKLTGEVADVKNTFETKSKAVISEITNKIKEARKTGEEWIHEPLNKLNTYKEELNAKLERTLHGLFDKMHLASKEEVADLDERLSKLEH